MLQVPDLVVLQAGREALSETQDIGPSNRDDGWTRSSDQGILSPCTFDSYEVQSFNIYNNGLETLPHQPRSALPAHDCTPTITWHFYRDQAVGGFSFCSPKEAQNILGRRLASSIGLLTSRITA